MVDKAGDQETEIAEVYEALKAQTVSNVFHAFNEGYLLGLKHAREKSDE